MIPEIQEAVDLHIDEQLKYLPVDREKYGKFLYFVFSSSYLIEKYLQTPEVESLREKIALIVKSDDFNSERYEILARYFQNRFEFPSHDRDALRARLIDDDLHDGALRMIDECTEEPSEIIEGMMMIAFGLRRRILEHHMENLPKMDDKLILLEKLNEVINCLVEDLNKLHA